MARDYRYRPKVPNEKWFDFVKGKEIQWVNSHGTKSTSFTPMSRSRTQIFDKDYTGWCIDHGFEGENHWELVTPVDVDSNGIPLSLGSVPKEVCPATPSVPEIVTAFENAFEDTERRRQEILKRMKGM